MIKLEINSLKELTITKSARVFKGEHLINSIQVTTLNTRFGDIAVEDCEFKLHVVFPDKSYIVYDITWSENSDPLTASLPITYDVTSDAQLLKLYVEVTSENTVIGKTNTVNLQIYDAPKEQTVIMPREELEQNITELEDELESAQVFIDMFLELRGDYDSVSERVEADEAAIGSKLDDVDGEIKTNHIDSAAVTSAKIADGAVTNAKLSSGAVAFLNLDHNLQETLNSKNASDSAALYEDNVFYPTWRQGIPNENTGVVDTTKTTRICTQRVRIPAYAKELVMNVQSGYKCAWYAYDISGTYIDKYYWLSNSENIIEIGSDWAYLIIGLAETSNSDIATSAAPNISLKFTNKMNDWYNSVNLGYSPLKLRQGYYNSSKQFAPSASSYANTICTGIIPVKQGDYVRVSASGFKRGVLIWHGSDLATATTFRTEDSAAYTPEEIVPIIADGFICVNIKKTDNGDLTPSDFTGEIALYGGGIITKNARNIEGLKSLMIPLDVDTIHFGKYISGSVGDTISFSTSSATKYTVAGAGVEGGASYVIKTHGRTATTLYAAFVDSNNIILKLCYATVTVNDSEVVLNEKAPLSAAKVYVNSISNDNQNFPNWLASEVRVFRKLDEIVAIEESLGDSDSKYGEQYRNVKSAQRVFSTTTPKLNTASNKLPTFMHVTDNHGDSSTFEKAVKIANDIGVDAILNTGDSVYYHATDDTAYLTQAMGNTNIPMLPVIGNHESFNRTEQQMYEKIIQPFESGLTFDAAQNGTKTYYYRDFSAQKLRVIALNQFQYRGNSNTQRHYYQEQIDFLCSALLTAPDDYGVIILMHTPEKSITKDIRYSRFYQEQSLFETTGANFCPVYDIVDAYISGEALSETYNNVSGNSPATFSVNVDFSLKNDSEFIAYVCGHMHRDTIGYVPNTTNTQLVLNSVCTNAWSHKKIDGTDGDTYPSFTELSDLPRIRGDFTETALNVYTIDRDAKTVRVVRIGSDTPYDFSARRDYMVIPYVLPDGIVRDYTINRAFDISAGTLNTATVKINEDVIVSIPDGVEEIGSTAFRKNGVMTDVVMPDSVTSIENGINASNIATGAFYDCTNLKNVVFSEELEKIGSYAFYSCAALTSVTIPNSVETIGDNAFAYCYNLTSVKLSEHITSIANNTFRECVSLPSIEIPDGVTTIGAGVFNKCTSLASITIPDSVTSIGNNAFKDCTSLSDVYYTGTQAEWGSININYGSNTPLTNATIHFEYVPE